MEGEGRPSAVREERSPNTDRNTHRLARKPRALELLCARTHISPDLLLLASLSLVSACGRCSFVWLSQCLCYCTAACILVCFGLGPVCMCDE